MPKRKKTKAPTSRKKKKEKHGKADAWNEKELWFQTHLPQIKKRQRLIKETMTECTKIFDDKKTLTEKGVKAFGTAVERKIVRFYYFSLYPGDLDKVLHSKVFHSIRSIIAEKKHSLAPNQYYTFLKSVLAKAYGRNHSVMNYHTGGSKGID
ncbi:MAG: hypothetical protein Q7S21_01070 [archaeon]|nr:hypothetical protein [archaeon]